MRNRGALLLLLVWAQGPQLVGWSSRISGLPVTSSVMTDWGQTGQNRRQPPKPHSEDINADQASPRLRRLGGSTT